MRGSNSKIEMGVVGQLVLYRRAQYSRFNYCAWRWQDAITVFVGGPDYFKCQNYVRAEIASYMTYGREIRSKFSDPNETWEQLLAVK